MTSKSKEPTRTGKRIKTALAFDNTPSRENAPAGGCKQINFCPRAIASSNAKPQAIGEVP